MEFIGFTYKGGNKDENFEKVYQNVKQIAENIIVLKIEDDSNKKENNTVEEKKDDK